jgi:hypothetical protein
VTLGLLVLRASIFESSSALRSSRLRKSLTIRPPLMRGLRSGS